MKKWILGLFLFLFTSVHAERTMLLVLERSGSTWMRYSLEFLTKRPTLGPIISEHEAKIYIMYGLKWRGAAYPLPISTDIDLGVDYDRPFIFKVHHYKAGEWDEQEDQLIFQMRNYKELLIRNFRSKIEEKTAEELIDSYFFKDYIGNLQTYHRWNPEKRHFIYYEDLMGSPECVFPDLLAFLGENDLYLEEFLRDNEIHRENCKKHYNKYQGGVQSKIGDDHFYSKKVSHEKLQEIDDALKNRYPVLWENYLHRYAEENRE